MRTWKTPQDLELVETLVTNLREHKHLRPGGPVGGDPVDLRGLAFPTVTMCEQLGLHTLIATRISGSQKFDDVMLMRVDLSEAMLEFSVWNNCRFEEVTFDDASLRHARFFGCVFERCSFRSTALSHASLSVGRNGTETQVRNSSFDRAVLDGASCHNPVFMNVRFDRCKLGSFVFDSPLLDQVEFVGAYKSLSLRGMPKERERNRAKIDLAKARICWLNADDGLDLTWVKLPADGSCMLITDRVRAVKLLADRLDAEGSAAGAKVGHMLLKLYSDKGISPLSADQTMFVLSRGMVADFAEESDPPRAAEIFEKVRRIAEEAGFLGKTMAW
jgi:uncharacterized protein YjbI with pentapeptide repeats